MAFGVRFLITEGASEIGVGPRMMATGSDSGNSGSESWLKYLKSSPDSVGEGRENSEAEPASRTRSSDRRDDVGPSSVRRRVDSVNAPETSTSSGWSGSWIEKLLNPGDTSSAPGDGQQPQGEVDQPAANVMGPEAPDPMWLKNQIGKVFFQIKGRKSGENVLRRLFDELRLETGSPEKRRQIVQILDDILSEQRLRVDNRNPKLNLNTELLVRISDWERDQ
ncbi:hypothetical protein K2173_012851 (mitochondrion) [Erythroxylum novogranatense]|uniref:Uncharacterized protein n=1 Tax=Erythroxylum novogranatense TaxID=1862640 RepID=A0AAV8S4A0_9ROSI|nr:hypothetical protein K2173_012851 [Erythroxylum novogranatense]